MKMSIEERLKENTQAMLELKAVMLKALSKLASEETEPQAVDKPKKEKAAEKAEEPECYRTVVNELTAALISDGKRDLVTELMKQAGIVGRGALANANDEQLKTAYGLLKNV